MNRVDNALIFLIFFLKNHHLGEMPILAFLLNSYGIRSVPRFHYSFESVKNEGLILLFS
jgi:hypothetical protein